eukprot:Opistho-2@84941
MADGPRKRRMSPSSKRDEGESARGHERDAPNAREDALVWLIGLGIGAAIALVVSLSTTGTFAFEADDTIKATVGSAWRSINMRVFGVPEFSPSELSQYDGSDPTKPIYLAIMDRVYDVTAGKNTYGPGGSYSHFAGKDASRAFVTGNFKKDLTRDLRGLSESQVAEIQKWVDFYDSSTKYFFVGIVKRSPNEITDDEEGLSMIDVDV